MIKCLRKLFLLMVLINFISLFGGVGFTRAASESSDENRPGGRLTISGNIGGKVNPYGLAVFGEFNYRKVFRYDASYHSPVSYLQTGAGMGVSPAAMQAGFHIEALPWIFLPLRIQYDYYEFFGTSGGLLSFSSPDVDYSDSVRNARSDEELAHAHRLLFQPTIQGKIDRFFLRNQMDLSYYRFSGKGPFFLELSYDTLLKDGDYLVSNRTFFLYSILEGYKNKTLLAGPYYDLTYAFGAHITQQKIGIAAYWEGALKQWHVPNHCLALAAGYHLQDPNRRNQFYLMISTGFRFSFWK